VSVLQFVKPVGAFETTDGIVFKTADQARRHQLFLNLKLVRDALSLEIHDDALFALAVNRHKLQAALDVSRVA
jgi:hypothetical protein